MREANGEFRLVVFWLAAFVAIELAPGADLPSHDGGVRRMSFSVQIRGSVLNGPDAEPSAWLPGRDVVIFAPPIDKRQSNRSGRDWLLNRPPFLAPRAHEFDVRDGSLTPAVSIALVGDTVKETTLDGRAVKMIAVDYPADSRYRDEAFLLHKVASGPVPLMFVVESNGKAVGPAYMVVSDHGFGQVTNDAGVAVFDQWPIECDMEIVVWCPTIKRRTSMTSSALKVLPNRKCVVPAGEDAATHTIRIDAAGK